MFPRLLFLPNFLYFRKSVVKKLRVNNNINGLLTKIRHGGSSLVTTYYCFTMWFKITLRIIKEQNKSNEEGN